MNNITTFDNYPPFATNGSRNMNTESAKYAVGFLEGETFPAEWANYLFHGATKGVSDLNTAVQSIWKENINVIQGSGQTPSSSDNTQLKTAIELMIQNAVLTANSQVLAQAKLDAHPVGSLYWSSDPTDPSTLFGGTWVRIKDRFVLAAGDTYGNGATGGSATVKLTESELPTHEHWFTPDGTVSSHSHGLNGHTHKFSWSGSHSHYTLGIGTRSETSENFGGGIDPNRSYGPNRIATSTETISISKDTEGNSGDTTSVQPSFSGIRSTTESSGSQKPFSILPPYICKFCWERTA